MPDDIHWYELLTEVFGINLNERRAMIWLQEMRAEDALGRITEDELCSALRWVRKQREGEQYRRTPTLEMVIGWVKWYRKEMAGDHRGYRNESNFVGLLKAEMLKAKDHKTRWNIMCDPCNCLPGGAKRYTSLEECGELDSWAATRWPDWDAEVIKIKRQIGRAIGESVGNTVASWKADKTDVGDLPYAEPKSVRE